MTGAEFSKPMIALASAFKGKFALNLNDSETVKDTVMDNWYEFFKDYRPEAFSQIVREWIEKEDKAPLIKDLRTKTRLLSERMDKKEQEEREHEEFIKTHDLALGINDDGFDEDRAKHPFEDGWRITDEGYWINQNELR